MYSPLGMRLDDEQDQDQDQDQPTNKQTNWRIKKAWRLEELTS